MRLPAKKILLTVLFMALCLMPGYGFAQGQSQGEQQTGAKDVAEPAIPDLADIVPLATVLTGRLAALENQLKGGPDIALIQKRYDEISADLEVPSGQLQRSRDSKDYRFNKLLEIQQILERENQAFEKADKPIRQAVRQLGAWRKEWLKEKENWHEWQSNFLAEGEFEQLNSIFEKANDTINTALHLILPRLEIMLKVQEKAGHILAKINALAAELDGMLLEKRRSAVINVSPPMFSSEYFSQFRGGIWYSVKNGLDGISWPESQFLAQQGWVLFIQGLFSLFVIIAVYRNRRMLTESKRWSFLAARPFSAGFFLGGMTTMLIYEYGGAPAIWKLVNIIVSGIFFARLSSSLVEASWKRQFVYSLMMVLIANRLVDVLSFPLPLFRLYMVLAALVGLLLCLRWARESDHHEESRLYTVFLRLAALFLAVIIIVQLWGKATLALFLFISFIDSMATVIVFMLFLYMMHCGMEWLFGNAFSRKAAERHAYDADAVIRRMTGFVDVAIYGLVLLPGILMIWDVFDSLGAATKGLLSLGFNLGDQRISVGLVLVAAGILYGSFFISWVLRKLLMDEVLVKRKVEKGVRLSMARLVNYAIIFIGFLLALSTLGFEVSKITIILSALGVGIGFGLQGVVNNFVSGLILLFERPVRMGDTIEISGKWAEIKHIGLRATTVQTFDQADVIIPNADLINNQVTNWTLSNRQVRLTVPVGVAYGSDVPMVMETLMACTEGNAMVARTPAPRVLFLSFGESSLDFELRLWVKDADYRLNTSSALHQEIDRRFREANIEIAFPQRDLHMRSVDDSVRVGLPAKSFITEKA